MAKCPRGKAQRSVNLKFTLAYANMYASAVCRKITPGGKKGRKKAANGGLIDMTKMSIVMAKKDCEHG